MWSLLFLLLSIPLSSTLDHSYEGAPIILQTDFDTVVIHTKISPVRKQLSDLSLEIKSIRNMVLRTTNNNLGKNNHDDPLNKFLAGILNAKNEMLLDQVANIDSFFRENETREKRALEFLGSFLSTCTGVPSARDHRKVLEKIRMLQLDSQSLLQIMESTSKGQKDIISSLQTHETEIRKAEQAIKMNSYRLLAAEKANVKMAAIFSAIVKADEIIMMANLALKRCTDILSAGDMKHLSRSSIGLADLTGIINNLYLKRHDQGNAPIFSGAESDRYYEMPIAHSWTHKDKREVITLLQIPVAPHNTDYEIRILEPHNIVRYDLGMAIVSQSTNSYRLISDSDFHRCIETAEGLICQKRNIVIYLREGCYLKSDNCADWADLVIHDLTNTQIMVRFHEKQSAKLTCDGQKDGHFDIPKAAILTIPLDCDLVSSRFHVARLNYANLAHVNAKLNEVKKLDLLIEHNAFEITPLRELNLTLKDTTSKLGQMKDQNEQLITKFNAYKVQHDQIWSAMRGGDTEVEQILIWTFMCVTTIALILISGWIFKLQIASWRREGTTGGEEKERQALMNRLMDLETEMKLKHSGKEGDKSLVTNDPKNDTLE